MFPKENIKTCSKTQQFCSILRNFPLSPISSSLHFVQIEKPALNKFDINNYNRLLKYRKQNITTTKLYIKDNNKYIYFRAISNNNCI